MDIITTHKVTGQQISDLMITAIEGGSNYWCKSILLLGADKMPMERPWYSDPTTYDGALKIAVHEDEPSMVGSDGVFVVGPVEFAEGFRIMCDNYPGHWEDFITDNGDATTADVWLQCVCFGEILYS